MNSEKTSPVFNQNLLDFTTRRTRMSKILIGFVLGLIVASVGFSGIARIADRGVQTIQTQSKELAQ
jgi:hypothetical protein